MEKSSPISDSVIGRCSHCMKITSFTEVGTNE